MQIDNKPVFSTKYPWSITIGLALDLFFILLFSYRIASGDMSIFESSLLFVGIFYIIHLIVCPYAGKVIVHDNKLKIDYFFIWNENYEIELNRITAISISGPHKYRTYSKIYLTIGEKETKILNMQTLNGFFRNESLESSLIGLIVSNGIEKK